MFKTKGRYSFVHKGVRHEDRKTYPPHSGTHRTALHLRLLPGGQGGPVIRVQVHASLYDYLERLQKEADGEEVTEIIVSYGSRAARMKPHQIRDEMAKKTPKAEWQFLPPDTLEAS